MSGKEEECGVEAEAATPEASPLMRKLRILRLPETRAEIESAPEELRNRIIDFYEMHTEASDELCNNGLKMAKRLLREIHKGG